MLKWLFWKKDDFDAAKIHAAQVQASHRQANWTEHALRRLEEWEAAVNGLCFAGVIGTGDAVQEIEHIARIRIELGFRVNDAEWNAARNYEAASADMGAMVAATRKHRDQLKEDARARQEPELAQSTKQHDQAYDRPGWKPGVEHAQPHPVKENADGTLYYKGKVYRMVGKPAGHTPKKPKELPRRRRWKKAGIAV